MINVLFVCLGNICRSPMAEAIFRHKVKARGLEKTIHIESCGTSNYHIGDNADTRTLAVVRDSGMLIDHFVRQLTTDDLQQFDYIVAMDQANLRNILRLASRPEEKAKVFLMRDFDGTGKDLEVPDPYYGNEKHFKEVFDMLDLSTERFLNFLVEKSSS